MSASVADRPYDVIAFGATGYTGQLVVNYLADRQLHNRERVAWAIAGRSRAKLEQVKATAVARNPELKDLAIVIADSSDQKSIDDMVQQTRVLLTTAGPYQLYGWPVVDACVKYGTHYVDLTGENNYIRDVIDKHHETATAQGTHIVPSCGYDSIPSDLSVLALIEEAKKRGKVVARAHGLFQSNGTASGGTIASAMELMKLPANVLQEMKHPFYLNHGTKPAPTPMDSNQVFIEYNSVAQRWVVPSPLAPGNSRVVRRSGSLLAYPAEFHYREGAVKSSFVKALVAYLSLVLVFVVLAVPFLRKAIYPLLPQPGTGPSEAKLKKSFFRQQTIGECTDGSRIVVEVAGGDPGYTETSKMIAEAAICLAKAKLPSKGGVLTPAASMGTELIDRLGAAGLQFRVLP